MKVLHVMDTSVPDTAGYTTRGMYLVDHQKKLGIEPVVLTSERFKTSTEKKGEVINGVQYYRTPKGGSFLRRIPLLSVKDEITTLYHRIREVATQEGVDLIHAHSPSLIGAAGGKYCRENGIPLIYEIRAFWEDAAVDRGSFSEGSWQYTLRRAHETSVVKGADKVIVICDGLKRDLVARGITEEKLHVVRNGVDCDAFVPLQVDNDLKTKLLLRDKSILGFIGSFFNFEGLHDLILAMKIIASQRDDIVLLLVGSGQVHDQLKILVEKSGLQNKVIFTGRVPHDEVAKYYSIIDVLIYPRIKKRITDLVTPLKPLEAMAMAKPVVMSNVGGLLELADAAGVAEIYKSGDINQLAETCIRLCCDEPLRRKIGESARQNVLKSWGWHMRAKESINVYGNEVCRR